MAVLKRLRDFCESKGDDRMLKELQSLLDSKQSTVEQCKEMIIRLEEVCRDIHECYQEKN